MKIETYKCDVCGVQSILLGNMSGWLKVVRSHYRVIVAKFDTTAYDDEDNLKHVCGASCAQKEVSKFTGSNKEAEE